MKWGADRRRRAGPPDLTVTSSDVHNDSDVSGRLPRGLTPTSMPAIPTTKASNYRAMRLLSNTVVGIDAHNVCDSYASR